MQPTRNQVICDKFHYDCLFLKICALVHTCDTHLNIDVRSCLNFTSAFLQHSGETILFFCCFFYSFCCCVKIIGYFQMSTETDVELIDFFFKVVRIPTDIWGI